MSLWRVALKNAVGIGELAQDSAARLENALENSLDKARPSSFTFAGSESTSSTRTRSKKAKKVGAKSIRNVTPDRSRTKKVTPPPSPQEIVCSSDSSSESDSETVVVRPVKKRRMSNIELLTSEEDVSQEDNVVEDSIVIASDSDEESTDDRSPSKALKGQILGTVFDVTLTIFDLETLRPGGWLTSNIIKAYFGALAVEKRHKCFGWIDSMLYTQLATEGNKRKKTLDLSDKLAYFTAIHKQKNHWCLLLVSNLLGRNKKRIVLYLDPRKPKAVDRKALPPLILLDGGLKDACSVSHIVQKNSAQPKSNSDLCGVYVCWYIDRLMDIVTTAETGELMVTDARKHIATSMKKMVEYRKTIRDVLLCTSVEDSLKRKTIVSHWDDPDFGLKT